MLNQKTRKIMVWNMKGGVAKTTTVINLSFGLANKGKKVLMCDLGFQNNIEDWLKIKTNKPSLYSGSIMGNKVNSLVEQVAENLYLIRLVESMEQVAHIIKNNVTLQLLTDSLDEICEEYGFDYVFFDSAPEMTKLHQTILGYAEELFIPVNMEYSALRGVMQVIQIIQQMESKIRISKVIPTMKDSRWRRSMEVVHMLKSYFKNGEVAKGIRVCSKLSECNAFHLDIFSFASSSTGAEDYNDLILEVLKDEVQNVAG